MLILMPMLMLMPMLKLMLMLMLTLTLILILIRIHQPRVFHDRLTRPLHQWEACRRLLGVEPAGPSRATAMQGRDAHDTVWCMANSYMPLPTLDARRSLPFHTALTGAHPVQSFGMPIKKTFHCGNQKNFFQSKKNFTIKKQLFPSH